MKIRGCDGERDTNEHLCHPSLSFICLVSLPTFSIQTFFTNFTFKIIENIKIFSFSCSKGNKWKIWGEIMLMVWALSNWNERVIAKDSSVTGWWGWDVLVESDHQTVSLSPSLSVFLFTIHLEPIGLVFSHYPRRLVAFVLDVQSLSLSLPSLTSVVLPVKL